SGSVAPVLAIDEAEFVPVKTQERKYLAQVVDGVIGIVGHGPKCRVVAFVGLVQSLDVLHFVSKLAKPNDVVQEIEAHAGIGQLSDRSDHDGERLSRPRAWQ